MVPEKWLLLREKVETRIEPILEKAGLERVGDDWLFEEESAGTIADFAYESADGKKKVGVDALERFIYENGQRKHFIWLRVEVGPQYLRLLFPLPPNSDIDTYEAQGWKFINEEQLDNSIDEIVEMLKKHFDIT